VRDGQPLPSKFFTAARAVHRHRFAQFFDRGDGPAERVRAAQAFARLLEYFEWQA
jgi:hypothetical protein